MNIQIFGTKKCNDTKKAERFFKDRGIKYQFIDMKEKGMSEHKAREEWEYVEKSQHARHAYITGKKRGDRHTRDILLNSSLLGWDKTADVIIDLVERRYDIDEEALKKEA